MSANTNSSVIADQANAITSGITTQRDGLSRINNGLDDAVISTELITAHEQSTCTVSCVMSLVALT